MSNSWRKTLWRNRAVFSVPRFFPTDQFGVRQRLARTCRRRHPGRAQETQLPLAVCFERGVDLPEESRIRVHRECQLLLPFLRFLRRCNLRNCSKRSNRVLLCPPCRSPLPIAAPPRVPRSPNQTRRRRNPLPPHSLALRMRRRGKPTFCLKAPSLKPCCSTRLDGAFAGPIECLVTGDVYSLDRQHY